MQHRIDPATGLREETVEFYRLRRSEGLIPTELAIACIRNEEARHGNTPGMGEVRRLKSRVKKLVSYQKPPLIVRQAAMAKKELAVKREAAPKKPVYAETDTRLPLVPIRCSYEDAMARKSF